MSKVLITGATGQDGTLLAQHLSEQPGYHVISLTRSTVLPAGKHGSVTYKRWAPENDAEVQMLIRDIQPDIMINLAAVSTGIGMFDNPEAISRVNSHLVLIILEAIRKFSSKTRFVQVGSSEMFGNTPDFPQTEESEFRPRTPYGAAKVFAHQLVQIYRDTYSLHLSNAICYNHESIYRSENFLTMKLVAGALAVRSGGANKLDLFNLRSSRDWSCAKDFVRGFMLVAKHTEPNDYIFASGRLTTVGRLCEIAFGHLGLDYRDYVNETFPDDPGHNNLVGNPSRIEAIGFERTRTIEQVLVEMLNFLIAKEVVK